MKDFTIFSRLFEEFKVSKVSEGNEPSVNR